MIDGYFSVIIIDVVNIVVIRGNYYELWFFDVIKYFKGIFVM